MKKSQIFATVKLTDKQFDEMEISTKRDLILQLKFIETTNYEYMLGAQSNDWVMTRCDKVYYKTVDMDTAVIVDRWD